MKLLLVEDEKELSKAIKKVLEINKYEVEVAYNGLEALELIEYGIYDAIILDVMMPKVDGITVVKKMRKDNNNTPVLMLTAKAEIDDRVLGLDAGADDYLTKPFAMKELLARIRSVTRRKGEVIDSYKLGNMILDSETFELCAEDNRVRLTTKEYRLMEYLIRNKNVLLSTEKILDNVWEYDTDVELNVVWVFISSLRKKMEKIGADYTIKSIRGVGYQLELRNSKNGE